MFIFIVYVFFEFFPIFCNIPFVAVMFFSRTDNDFQFLSCSFSVHLKLRLSRMSSPRYLSGSCVPAMHIQCQLLSWGKEFLTHLDNITSPYSFFFRSYNIFLSRFCPLQLLQAPSHLSVLCPPNFIFSFKN